MTYLLDVNVLIALIDPTHVSHDRAHSWFHSHNERSWATCPITENGVIRIAGSSQYPNSTGRPAAVLASMRSLQALTGHVFWPDDISLWDMARFDHSRLLSSTQVTESYLLALASAHGGQLATLNRRLISDAVVGGGQALHLVG